MDRIVSWFRQPFHLLDTVRARLKLVLFCGVFGCLFLNIFHPFNLTEWFVGVKTPLFVILTFFSAAGMAALALTQFVFRSVFRIQLTTRIGFLQWLLVEFFVISVAVHTVNILVLGLPFVNLPEYLITLKYTLLILVLPYFLGILLLFVEQQLLVVEELTVKINKASLPDTISIADENGKVTVSLPVQNIICFKADDNYVVLYHKRDQVVQKELIRTNLKRLEQDMNPVHFIRIHRSYIINCLNLAAAMKTARGYQVRMQGVDFSLPVSATYQQAFEERVIQQGA
ncbi:MAG: LytTR family transcriptional regulator [Cyclobacteriaceae bacterium]|nr:LytTR family transcriptional regulator [Cyclobacteriaceae bacterium]